ncbi:RimK family alpha-L-glutamate ligase [Candidatus Beckwithbacteria bacterium]|nr:RimK family alpha-L-glutamate ligase [Candidatus Beckwithbacteria bacterium]
MKNLLLFSKYNSNYQISRIKEECELRNINIQTVSYLDLNFEIKNNIPHIYFKKTKESLLEYDNFIFRGFVSFDFFKELLCLYLSENHKNVLNKNVLLNTSLYINKLIQVFKLSMNNLPVVNSNLYGSTDVYSQEEAYPFPFILKGIVGSYGNEVMKIDNNLKYRGMIVNKQISDLIFQPFLPTGEDYRILVLGGRVLGVMKRIAQEGKYLTNVSAGGKFEKAELTKELEDLSLKAAKVFGADYCGVDIMYDQNNKPHILEVNFGAQFKGFEKCTGLNIAGQIIDYLVP